MKTWTTSSGRVKGVPQGREWLWFFVFLVVLAAVTALPTWFVAGWLGVEGYARLFVTGQAPSVALLLIWLLALMFPVRV